MTIQLLMREIITTAHGPQMDVKAAKKVQEWLRREIASLMIEFPEHEGILQKVFLRLINEGDHSNGSKELSRP